MMIRRGAVKGLLAHSGLRSFAMLLSLAFLSAGSPARAQQPSASALAAAKELIEIKGATHMFDPVVPGVIETAKNTLLRTNTALAKELNDVAAQLRQQYAEKRTEVANQIARIYAQRFTEAEIKQATAFYKTPLGKKMIEQEPRVLEESMRQIQTWADEFSQEILRRFREEMRKKGHNL